MSRLVEPDPVKPVLALFSADRSAMKQAAARFEDLAGVLDYAGPETPFDLTPYYSEEMGGALVKRLLSAEALMDPTGLIDLKIGCRGIEDEFLVDGRRAVNLDPGYLAADKLVLATGKPAAHRIYLGRGVWADLTLIYRFGAFQALPWTYPDFASDDLRAAATDIRKRYLDQLRSCRREEK